MPKLSAVVLTKNEEKNIERCLQSLGWVDEIIVIDDFSRDNTVKIAESRGARVFQKKLERDFSSQRDFGLEKVKHDWVLFIDADEVVTSSLAKEIVRRLKKTSANGFQIPRKEFFINRPLRSADKPSWDWSPGPLKLLRLGKKTSGKWQGKVHEVWKIRGKIGDLHQPIYHYSYTNLTKALKKINFYSSIRAESVFKKGGKISAIQIFTYPTVKFLKNFFWHLGFLDKTTGLIFSTLMSLQSFLVKAKLWHHCQARGDR